jgi:hypothetical protein
MLSCYSVWNDVNGWLLLPTECGVRILGLDLVYMTIDIGSYLLLGADIFYRLGET